MHHTARFCAALLALGGLVFGAASLPACSSSSGEKVESPCPPGTTCQVSLTLLHTADIHSRLFPYDQVITQVDSTLGLGELNTTANIGGVARMAYVLGRERARSGRVLHLDSGDCFQGAPIFNFFKGEPEVRSMSALGVDAAVLGNHEFDTGAQNLATQMQRWSSFPLLSANYKYETPQVPNPARLGTITKPFVVLNTGGLKVAAIGMANLSTLTSVFDQPNKFGITPLNTVEVAQFYVDLLRPYVDLVVMVTHLGLEVDQRMVRNTTGIDVVLGGHNHVVINPPQEINDCSADPNNPGYVWALDPNATIDPDKDPPDDPEPELTGPAGNYDPINHPYAFKRVCSPRRVLIAHSGAFAKYVGRLDLVLTNDPAQIPGYDPINGFEVQTSRYTAFPIDASVPEDPVLVDLLHPYRRSLDLVADLDLLVGYSPDGAKRTASTNGDSPLGNLVGNAIWFRLGVQTDFSLTNSTGIRTDLNPGPVTVEQMYNIFPFDNSISKMQLSGVEVQELFDFAARRSSGRGCTSQIQIAGARVRLNCGACTTSTDVECTRDEECTHVLGRCDQGTKRCVVGACADQVFIGNRTGPDGKVVKCRKDDECGEPVLPGICDRSGGREIGNCMTPISPTNLYELATSNYLAGGGSGYRVLQRNTTQVDTKIQQRDALIDYLRAGHPCGWDPAKNLTPDGLKACSADADCADKDYVCSCPGHVGSQPNSGGLTCVTQGTCDAGQGRCVRKSCRDDLASFRDRRCTGAPQIDACRVQLHACEVAGEECKILSCIDGSMGAATDGRVQMVAQ